MNLTHIHLLLNHFPIIGTLIATVLLLAAFVAKKEVLKTVASIILIAMAVLAIPVYFTGEPAEESVEHLVGVATSMIESHEDAAMISLILLSITGVVAVTTLIYRRTSLRFARWDMALVALLAFSASGGMIYTGYLGGQIRHSEIRSGFVAGQETGTPESAGTDSDDEKAPSPKAATTGTAGSTVAPADSTATGSAATKSKADADGDND